MIQAVSSAGVMISSCCRFGHQFVGVFVLLLDPIVFWTWVLDVWDLVSLHPWGPVYFSFELTHTNRTVLTLKLAAGSTAPHRWPGYCRLPRTRPRRKWTRWLRRRSLRCTLALRACSWWENSKFVFVFVQTGGPRTTCTTWL